MFNFRPVSNLRFVSKLIEKAVFLQFNDYLLHDGLHKPLQSAYKALHSTETAFIRVYNDIILSVGSGQNVILVLLDKSAAFDTMNHEILLTRLHQHFGIRDTTLDWLRDYLRDRTQFVNIQHDLLHVIGVPQGSVLGPVLYLMVPLLTVHVSDICLRMQRNELKLNKEKTDILLIHSKFWNCPSLDEIILGNEQLTMARTVITLGIIFAQEISFNDQINQLCRTSFSFLRNLFKIHKYLTDEATSKVVLAFVTTKLDYCNHLYFGLPKYQVNKMQRV